MEIPFFGSKIKTEVISESAERLEIVPISVRRIDQAYPYILFVLISVIALSSKLGILTSLGVLLINVYLFLSLYESSYIVLVERNVNNVYLIRKRLFSLEKRVFSIDTFDGINVVSDKNSRNEKYRLVMTFRVDGIPCNVNASDVILTGKSNKATLEKCARKIRTYIKNGKTLNTRKRANESKNVKNSRKAAVSRKKK